MLQVTKSLLKVNKIDQQNKLIEKDSFVNALQKKILLFDGAMGTEIQKYNPTPKDFPNNLTSSLKNSLSDLFTTEGYEALHFTRVSQPVARSS